MAAGAPEGARVVFLKGAEQRLDIAAWERGLELIWRAGAPAIVSDAVWTKTQAFNALALDEWSPAHLRAVWNGGDIGLSWIRRARRDGDPWLPGEPPLSAPERYVVAVSGTGVAREWQVDEPAAAYTEADRLADFPAGGDASLTVSQLGSNGQPGAQTVLQIVIPAP